MVKAKHCLIVFEVIIFCLLAALAKKVVSVDPFFHYHYPLTEEYYYTLDNERSMNNGIVKHFDYDALITGTSMTENFRTSEFDSLFDAKSVKVCFSGGTYEEINNNVLVALKKNPRLKNVVRGLDYVFLLPGEEDAARFSLGVIPEFLYDDNYLNDSEYLFNRDVIFNRVYSMGKNRYDWDFVPGITSFDGYSNWMDCTDFIFGNSGVQFVYEPILESDTVEQTHLSAEEREAVLDNITRNVTSAAETYPDVIFYYFLTPYSAAYWYDVIVEGKMTKYAEAERIAIEEMLKYDNIRLYSFNNCLDITGDLNNYKDYIHYGEWINSLILKWMHDGKYLLTDKNYLGYLETEYKNYSEFDYSSLTKHEDYRNDYYADALIREQYTGLEPMQLLGERIQERNVRSARMEATEDGIRIICSPLAGDSESFEPAPVPGGYDGVLWHLKDSGDHRYLVYDAVASRDVFGAGVYIFDSKQNRIASLPIDDDESGKHQYLIDIGNLGDEVIVLFDGGYFEADSLVVPDTVFENICLY